MCDFLPVQTGCFPVSGAGKRGDRSSRTLRRGTWYHPVQRACVPRVTAQEGVGLSQSPHTFGLAALSTHTQAPGRSKRRSSDPRPLVTPAPCQNSPISTSANLGWGWPARYNPRLWWVTGRPESEGRSPRATSGLVLLLPSWWRPSLGRLRGHRPVCYKVRLLEARAALGLRLPSQDTCRQEPGLLSGQMTRNPSRSCL